MRPDVSELRRDYDALLLVADGLIELLNFAANPLTIAEMARAARTAARKLASKIERMLTRRGFVAAVMQWAQSLVPRLTPRPAANTA